MARYLRTVAGYGDIVEIMKKCVQVLVDGPQVMQGKKAGVGALIKEFAPHSITTCDEFHKIESIFKRLVSKSELHNIVGQDLHYLSWMYRADKKFLLDMKRRGATKAFSGRAPTRSVEPLWRICQQFIDNYDVVHEMFAERIADLEEKKERQLKRELPPMSKKSATAEAVRRREEKRKEEEKKKKKLLIKKPRPVHVKPVAQQKKEDMEAEPEGYRTDSKILAFYKRVTSEGFEAYVFGMWDCTHVLTQLTVASQSDSAYPASLTQLRNATVEDFGAPAGVQRFARPAYFEAALFTQDAEDVCCASELGRGATQLRVRDVQE